MNACSSLAIRRFLLLAVLCLSIAACAAGNRAPAASPPTPTLSASAARRDRSPAAPHEALKAIQDGATGFTLDLYRALVGESQGPNMIASPYNLSVLLSQVHAGAKGHTAEEMAQVLHYALPQDQLQPAVNATDLSLAKGDGFANLITANGLWAPADVTLRTDYLDGLARNYGSEVQSIDVSTDQAIEKSRKAINDWISNQTHDQIQDLLEQGTLQSYTRLILASTIYFRAKWANPFASYNTGSREFTLANGEHVNAEMMKGYVHDLPYAEGASFRALQLPYEGGRFSMVILLPDQGKFSSFEKRLDEETISSITSSPGPPSCQRWYATTLATWFT